MRPRFTCLCLLFSEVGCARTSAAERISWLFGISHVNMFVLWRSRSNMSDLVGPGYQGCVDGSLTDGFSVFIQGLLAVLAFSTLMCKFLSLFKLNHKWNYACVWWDSVFFFKYYGYVARGLVCLFTVLFVSYCSMWRYILQRCVFYLYLVLVLNDSHIYIAWHLYGANYTLIN